MAASTAVAASRNASPQGGQCPLRDPKWAASNQPARPNCNFIHNGAATHFVIQQFVHFLGGPRHHPNFLRFWASDSISLFGAQITLLALPLTATILLHASPAQMGLLAAAETLPIGLFSLHAGAIIDRTRNLPLIKFSAVARGLFLLVVPAAAWLRMLSMEILFVVGFLVATLSVFADVAYQTLVVKLVDRDQLIDANAKIGLSESTASIAGPGIGGVLVQVLSAPFAIVLDAISFFVAATLLRTIKLEERVAPVGAHGPTITQRIKEGVLVVWNHALLRWTALLLATWQFLNHMFLALFVLFVVREIGLSGAAVGAVMSTAGVGFLLGSILVTRMSRRLGLGPTLLAGLSATTVAWLMVACASASGAKALASLCIAYLFEGVGTGLFFLTYISLRQGVTPEALLGRVISTMRFLTVAATPLGALLGGVTAQWIGLRETILLIGCGGLTLSGVALLYSPLRQIKDMPEVIGTTAPIASSSNG